MDQVLNDVEVRILGSLIEKEITTPDYYPLSLNALTNACNQTSNRYPVVHFDEDTVARALDSLRDKRLVNVVHKADSRVERHRQVWTEAMTLKPPEVAAMAVMMLRGPQTVGEIRTRSNRIYDFQSLEEVGSALDGLMARTPAPLVARLPRKAGQKEVRYAHLLSGEVMADDPPDTDTDRVSQLEQTVEGLRAQVENLQNQFDQFRNQFE